jgi:hypothetical protein
MGDREYKLTAAQGQFLLQLSATSVVPEKMGESTYSTVDRAIIQNMIAALFTELKAYSPYAQEYEPGKNSKLFFGPKDNWQQDKPEASRWYLKDIHVTTTVKLSKDAVQGATWVCYLTLVPKLEANQGVVSPSEAVDTVWPLLRLLKKADSVAESLGLKKYERKKHGWNDDPEEDPKPAPKMELVPPAPAEPAK